ncbi:SulP family inorganic anion transporter [Aquisalimonas asiatica]|uniref:Sulfate permease, SulP family n=1 Tax=Aquisalimonas asiatica TaxID=406100 RepID=A0A1H8PTY1_9GAMM|nr:SulP family inorganic anion transporter [Aquisalimonas asiatica]SEO45482.1 sulfate permease, SulP family [Aquisalimonas asiatica]
MTGLLPGWLRRYRRDLLPGDLLAALVVTMLLVPQGLAYAALAGLPPQLGLYASVAPLLVYALFGSSMVLSVGPVAVASLMTASALTPLADPGSPEYIAGAVLLAFLSGLMLFAFGLLRLGNLARLMSHPVISGFIAGAALLIIVGQLRPLLGVDAEGQSAVTLMVGVVRSLPQLEPLTAAIGVGVLGGLWAARIYLPGLLRHLGLSSAAAALGSRLAPMAAVIAVSALVAVAGLEQRLDVVGTLPAGLPQLVLPALDPALITPLLLPALIIGLIGFVESVAIAQAFARQRGQRIDPDAELRGLGAANVASALSGAFPVTGGFSRTAVNAEGGARTPLAGVFAAVLIALVLVFATGLFRALPMTVLAAVIIIAAVGLVDVAALRRVWRHDRMEGLAFAGTALGVLVVGVEAGVLFGVTLSLVTLIWRASHPHLAVVGRVPGTEHFRNVCRHRVETDARVLLVRIDENLFFGNAEAVQQQLETLVARDPAPDHLVLVMTSVSHVDATALDMLEALDAGLERRGIRLHLAEVKGPVMDGLRGGPLMARLRGEVFLSVNEAFETLAEPERNQ